MIQIDHTEVELVRSKYPDTHIRRTANKYYVEETPAVMRLLGRGTQMKGGGQYAGEKPRRDKA